MKQLLYSLVSLNRPFAQYVNIFRPFLTSSCPLYWNDFCGILLISTCILSGWTIVGFDKDQDSPPIFFLFNLSFSKFNNFFYFHNWWEIKDKNKFLTNVLYMRYEKNGTPILAGLECLGAPAIFVTFIRKPAK